MNIDDEVKVDHILAQADKLVPDSSPELLGAVGLPQFALYAQKRWHPKRGVTAECGSEGTLSRGLLHVFHVALRVDAKCCHV